MLLALFAYLAWREYRAPTGLVRTPLGLDRELLRLLARLGVPAALQLLLEMGSITVVTALAARLTATALAAHQVALSVASLTFMVPHGLSSAAAVVVARALGRGHPAAARRSGWLALLSGAGFMLAAAIALVAGAPAIVHMFTPDADVIAVGATLLWVAALFQLSDGVQVVATGVLRGTGDTRTAMVASLVGHWLVSVPLGVALCFTFGLGVVGLWLGLAAGLSSVAVVVLLAWMRCAPRLTAAPYAPPHGAGAATGPAVLSEPG
jgi:MATE family multidrug resistance protein